MTDLNKVYFKHLKPGESHLFVIRPMLPLFWYSFDYKYGINIKNKSESIIQFMTEMMDISSTGTVCIFDFVKKVINEIPGKYCLICSHFENMKPDSLPSSDAGRVNYLSLAFISLDELPEEFNNPYLI